MEAKLRDYISRVPDGVRAEPLMTEGPVSRAVLAAGELVKADLIVLTAHGTLADDHASVTQRVLEDGGRAVLVLHEPTVEPRTPRFASKSAEPQIVVAPTDLEPASPAALDLAFDLARQLAIDLHLLHVRSGVRAASESEAIGKLRTLIPRDLTERVTIHVEHGNVGRCIAAVAEKLSAVCIVMGEHSPTAHRRWFSRDTPSAVLHQAHCPVWYVPPARAA